MIDWHSHILPEMDDGSKSVAESLRLIAMQRKQGADTVIATPHFFANYESVDSFLARRQSAFEKVEPHLSTASPKIILGAEVKYYHGISKMERLKDLRVSGSEALILEMPFSKWTEYMVREIIELSLMGDVKLVLAHIERYLSMQSRDVWKRIYESDVLTQVNATFFESFYSRYKALNMLKQGKIHLIGSDCHNITSRSPKLDKAYEFIEKKLGRDFVNQMNEYSKSMLV